MKVPAKINLYLHVTGKRPDGYHLLDSLIVFTDICDEVEISPSDKFSLEISGPFAHLVENDERNIVARAAAAMAAACGREKNIAIKLVKNIPVGAGLGGGSGDCAATILLLNELWQAGLPQAELEKIGLKIGADVPVFIGRKAAFVSGIGEGLKNLASLPELYAILVYPHKALSTKDVFGHVILNGASQSEGSALKQSKEILRYAQDDNGIINFLKTQRNDLEIPAIKALPELKGLIEDLASLEGVEFARMSGSGSTCFAVFSDKSKAEKGLAAMRTKYPDYWVSLCGLVVGY